MLINMWALINENPTREKILILLKKKGPLAIEDLGKELNITSMGIRQHLLSLERRGLIAYSTKRQGIGRPAFMYTLTDNADDLFPKAYPEFLIEAFKDIEKHEGRKKIDDIFKWRKTRILKEMKETLAEAKNMHDRLSSFRDILESKGYFVEIADSNGHFKLQQFNCPIYKIATQFREACVYELQMYKDCLGKEINRKECLADGDLSCTYIIPKNI
jgi:predicted ArsR family transcriptional regulator